MGALYPGSKTAGNNPDHSSPSSATVKNTWSYTSTPPTRPHGVAFKYRDSFTCAMSMEYNEETGIAVTLYVSIRNVPGLKLGGILK
jgi:hypothetical protein